jgi:hypothetical protein
MFWYKLKTGFLAIIVLLSRFFVIAFEYFKKLFGKLREFIETTRYNKNR